MNPPFATLPVYFRALTCQGRVCVVEDLRRSAQRALRVEDGLADTERMVRAATAHRALIHPHIATVHEVDRADGMVWVVSELLSGGGLVPPLPPAEVHAILQTALRALAFAHRQGVIHGHLVPTNLLRAADGTWKITDFGLAVASGRMDRPHTPAPETFERASVKGDLFAVGNLALAALGGGLGEDYPSWKYWFERALAPPARRFASAEEMLTALRDIALPAKGLQEDGPTHPGARPRRAVPPLSSPPMVEALDHRVPTNGPAPPAEASETPPPAAPTDVASGPFTALPSPAVGAPEAPPPSSAKPTIKSSYTLGFMAGLVVLAALAAGVWWMRSPTTPEAAEEAIQGGSRPTVPPAPEGTSLPMPPNPPEALPVPSPSPPAAPPPQQKPEPVVSGAQGVKAPPATPSKPPAPASKIGSCKKGKGGAETAPASVFVGETSTLRISSKPWSEASLNGKPLGRSHRSYEVPTGCHTLTLVTEDGRTQSIDVTLAREALTVCWDFERGDVCSR